MEIRVLKSKNSSTVSIFRARSREGIVLAAVVICVLIFTILGFSVLNMVNTEMVLVQKAVDRTKAFYLAEAGLEIFAANLSSGNYKSIGETMFGEGSYSVDYYPDDLNEDYPYAIATGVVNGQEKRIKVTTSFLAPPYECGVYAGGSGGSNWTLILRGTGDPCEVFNSGISVGNYGGRDIINGNIFVDGDVILYQQSSVNPPLAPNPFELEGDVEATGSVDLYDSAMVSGDINEGVAPQDPPDLLGMNYAVNNTHNVAQIFADANVTQGNLPVGNELRDVFEKNPTNMVSECDITPGDDYFLTPSSGFIDNGIQDWNDALTPLDVGDGRVYYIDGDVWVHSKSAYGFKMKGKATIVATGNIHLCDNLDYADADSMLGLVALGKYDEDGDLVSGGNVYFGDPTTGTLYICAAMMFAANNFLYNSMAIDTFEAEPESGFIIKGNIAALNQVSIERDWYSVTPGDTGSAKRPARYDHATGKWYDSGTGVELTSAQVSTMKHFQMIINYDDRVRSQTTQPPGLPRGTGVIFEKLTNWEELP